MGEHVVNAWSKTQTTVALSSADAELTGICAAAGEGLGLQSLCRDLGFDVSIKVHSDAAAAIGVCKRKGQGRIRHLAVADLWIQDRIRTGDFEICKIPGGSNPSDILTKNVDWGLLIKHLSALHFQFDDGRPASASHI